MAKLSPNEIQFTGSIGNLSAYTMRGHNGIILRSKGGARKEDILRSPAFETTRNLNQEWRAVTKTCKSIRRGFGALRLLADYNFSGPLNGLIKKIQVADTVNPKGKRSILFSRFPDALSSFQFNRQTLFDTIIRQPIEVEFDKTTAKVGVTIPALQSLVNFFPNPRYVYFQMVLTCGCINDCIFDTNSNKYPEPSKQLPIYLSVRSEWMIAKVTQPAASFQLVPNNTFVVAPDTLFVCGAGIQYGMPGADGTIQPVPFAGAARILKTA